jgi:hypothetical protein
MVIFGLSVTGVFAREWPFAEHRTISGNVVDERETALK